MSSTRCLVGLIVASISLNACSDGGLSEPEGGQSIDSEALLELSCEVEVASGGVACGPRSGASGAVSLSTNFASGYARAATVFARLVSRDAVIADGIFSIDVAVQNLLTNQAMGTPDGRTVTGLTVFFLSPPSNGVELLNPDGTRAFTAPGQPFFKYDQILQAQQVSSYKPWRFRLNGAPQFSIQLGLLTDVPAPENMTPLTVGTLDFTVRGGLLPEGGYSVIVDENVSVNVPQVPATVRFTSVPVGEHTVRLARIVEGCNVLPNPRTVTVTEGGTAETLFDVTCARVEGFPPEAVTGSPSNVQVTSFRANGTVTANGKPTATWIEWGESQALGNRCDTGNISSGFDAVPVWCDFSKVKGRTTIYCRVVAENNLGSSQGSIESVTTLAGEPPQILSVDLPTSASATPGTQTLTGTLSFEDPDGDVMRLDVVAVSSNFTGGSHDVSQLFEQGVESGTLDISVNISCTAAAGEEKCDPFTLQFGYVLEDSAGNRSEQVNHTISVQ